MIAIQKQKGIKILENLFLKKLLNSNSLFNNNAPLIITNNGTPISPKAERKDEKHQNNE